KAGEIGNVHIIDTALEPIDQVQQKTPLILFLAFWFGIFVGLLVALFRNMLRSGVKDSSQIEYQLELPVYANIAHSPSQKPGLKLLIKKKSPIGLALKHRVDN